MIQINNFKLLSQIHESSQSIIYKAISEKEQKPVILKIMRNEHPTPEEISRFQREYDLTSNINIEGAIKVFELGKLENRFYIAMEDLDATSLVNWTENGIPSLEIFLKLSIDIIDILGKIHESNIIHKDIKPANLVLNSKSRIVKFIDFGISSKLSRENSNLKNPKVMEGTLAYMSPEQTGRMNRSVDYRSDFYSIGVTFYYMLTSQLPFNSEDSMEIVHSHIAKTPTRPDLLNKNLPKILSDIIMKLLSKRAEDRYQSARGIKLDLEKCLKGIETGKLEDFELGKKDISPKFQLPQKFYGREIEIQKLLATYERSSQGSIELMLVAGYSGIGKSSVINELQKPILAKRGFFISGKFDQFNRNVPYTALIKSFQELIGLILTEDEKVIQEWKINILNAIGNNGILITEIIPELESILGKQNPISELPPTEAQNRFSLVFQNFVKVFANLKHPLTIFLDDLQWADTPSLKLIELLLNDKEAKNIFMIGAYRDNEVDNTHMLMQIINNIENKNEKISTLSLNALEEIHVNQFIADTFQVDVKSTKEISSYIYQKTGGNPFFLNQFMEALYEDKLFIFDLELGWTWNIEGIKQKQITNNIVELVSAKIRKLPEKTINILKIAACIGNQFELGMLSIILGKTKKETSEDLWESLQEGLVIPIDENYKFITESDFTHINYKFLHDRVQQAAYSCLSENEKIETHFKIGKILIINLKDKIEENIFEIVNHSNIGSSLISNEEDKLNLAKLNLLAGNKAKASIAYKSALEFYKSGISLISENQWGKNYSLSIELHSGACEVSYLSNELEEMNNFINLIFTNGKDVSDKVKAYEMKILSLTANGKLRESVDVVLEILNLLGVHFPKKPNPLNTVAGLIGTKIHLGSKKIESLVDLPKMENPKFISAMKILTKAIAPVFISYPELMPFIVFRRFSLSVKFGNSTVSAFAYADYGLVLCGVVGDIEAGYRFGQLAMNLLDKFETKEVHARTYFAVNVFIRHWKEHLKKGINYFQEGYQIALETGDFEFGSFLAHMYTAHSYYIGRNLFEIEKEIESYSHSILKMKHIPSFYYNNLYWQVVLNLTGKTENPTKLEGEIYDERKNLPIHNESKDRYVIFNYYLQKITLCYMFEEYEEAIQFSELAEKNIEGVTAMICIPLFYFYSGLAASSLYDSSDSKTKKKLYKKLISSISKFSKWAKFSPLNHEHKLNLLLAEKNRIQKNEIESMDYYDKSIKGAKENGYIQEEALAYELAGKYYKSIDREKISKSYLSEAIYLYTSWGAISKSNFLTKKYPNLSSLTNKNSKPDSTMTMTGTHIGNTTTTEFLDISTIIKSSQVISGEIVLDKLLSRMMDVIIENAGAEKGFLALEKKGKWYIEAEGNVDSNEKIILQSLPIENLPVSIINYVIRTKETIVIHDAVIESKFKNDAYILDKKPKSILSFPLINQNQLKGIIYLENNLLTNAFTNERIEVLKVLSSQIAISIENARLYANMSELNMAYQRFVPEEFLKFLNRESIVDVKLGDQIRKEMSVLFSDIRSFTELSEKMTPEENFNFINSYLSRMGPGIRENNGFIDKYIGDAIMALFPRNAEDAIKASIQMMEGIKLYNMHRSKQGYAPISIGIGVHTGELMLGTVGEDKRMDTTVISDAVNLSSRLESMTKQYGVGIIVSEETLNKTHNKDIFKFRLLDNVIVKGKTQPIVVYEILDYYPEEILKQKLASKDIYEKAVNRFYSGTFPEAKELFEKVLTISKDDKAAKVFLERVEHLLKNLDDWKGASVLTEK